MFCSSSLLLVLLLLHLDKSNKVFKTKVLEPITFIMYLNLKLLINGKQFVMKGLHNDQNSQKVRSYSLLCSIGDGSSSSQCPDLSFHPCMMLLVCLMMPSLGYHFQSPVSLYLLAFSVR